MHWEGDLQLCSLLLGWETCPPCLLLLTSSSEAPEKTPLAAFGGKYLKWFSGNAGTISVSHTLNLLSKIWQLNGGRLTLEGLRAGQTETFPTYWIHSTSFFVNQYELRSLTPVIKVIMRQAPFQGDYCFIMEQASSRCLNFTEFISHYQDFCLSYLI